MEDAFPCTFCGEAIGHGQYAFIRRTQQGRVVFFHPACPTRTKRVSMDP